MTTALITGPTHGIGHATAIDLAKRGYKLFLLCRNREAGEALCAEINALPNTQPPHLLVADLGNLPQVKAAAEELLATGEPLHVLINNAGVINNQRKVVDGVEQMFLVNHLGHFLLTTLLLPRLKQSAPARIVVVASNGHGMCKGIQFNDLNFDQGFSTFKTYGHSKLANMLMSLELSQRLSGSGVTVNCLHPGAVASNMGKNNDAWYVQWVTALLKPFFLTPEQGAQTSIYLATENITSSGDYYVKSKIAKPKPWALDKQQASQLWALSETMTAQLLQKQKA